MNAARRRLGSRLHKGLLKEPWMTGDEEMVGYLGGEAPQGEAPGGGSEAEEGEG